MRGEEEEFSPKSSPKNLDLSDKLELDFWLYFGR